MVSCRKLTMIKAMAAVLVYYVSTQVSGCSVYPLNGLNQLKAAAAKPSRHGCAASTSLWQSNKFDSCSSTSRQSCAFWTHVHADVEQTSSPTSGCSMAVAPGLACSLLVPCPSIDHTYLPHLLFEIALALRINLAYVKPV